MAGTVADEDVSAASSSERYATDLRVAGRYRIVRFIAAGGMGEVYEADDLLLGARVALKTLRADRSASPRTVERMRRELALARRITHPNVCRMHDVGDHDGRMFLTMELLAGETLAERLHRGPLPTAELISIATQLIAALAAAHAAGVVHRDLKPGNVILVGDRAVVTDFGLARAAHADEDVALTGEAALLGTPGYMAPEQVEGRAATPATDIYALGVVLYELATGELPFREDTAMATATARLHKDPPAVGARRKDLDRRWTEAIMRCLARDPAQRFARVEDVGRAAPRRRRWIAVPFAAALGVAAVVAWTAGDRPAAVRSPAPEPGWPAHLRPASAKAAIHFDDAQRALLSGDRTEARELLEQAVAAGPEDPIAQAALAEVLAGLGYVERAHDASVRAGQGAATLALEPRALVEQVVATIGGDATAAVAAAIRLVELSPGEPAYRLRLARAQIAAEDADAAELALAGAASSIDVELARASIAGLRGDAGATLRHATAAATRAHAAGRAHDEGEALTLIAAAVWQRGDTATAARAYQAAIALGDAGVAVRARNGLIQLELAIDRMGDVAEHYRQNAALARTLGDRRLLVELLTRGARFQVEVGRLDDAAAGLAEARLVATARGDDVAVGWADAETAILALQRGELAEAARRAEAAFVEGRRLGVIGIQGNAFHTWSEALLELADDLALARARGIRGTSVERLVDCFAALREGDLDRADRIARTLTNLRTGEGRLAEAVIAQVAIARGDLDDARERLERLAPVAIGDGASMFARDRLIRAQAALAARQGDLPRALELLDAHATTCATAGLMLMHVLGAGLAAELAAAGDPGEASRRADAVIAVAEPLGFHRVVRDVRAANQRRKAAASSP